MARTRTQSAEERLLTLPSMTIPRGDPVCEALLLRIPEVRAPGFKSRAVRCKVRLRGLRTSVPGYGPARPAEAHYVVRNRGSVRGSGGGWTGRAAALTLRDT